MADYRPYRRKSWLSVIQPTREQDRQVELTWWVPNSHLRIREAMMLLGKQEISGWKGDEFEARLVTDPPDKPWLWRGTKQVDKYFTILETDEVLECSQANAEIWWSSMEPKLIEEWTTEKSNLQRCFECVTLMRNRLSDETYEAYALEKNGRFYEIPVNEWIGENGSKMLFSGVSNFYLSGYSQGSQIKGPVLLKADFLASASKNQPVPLTDLERFPYIRLLLSATASGLFVNNDRVEKKLIEYWLRKNWPMELGEATTTKISTLATYLRRPEDEKGGLKGKGTNL